MEPKTQQGTTQQTAENPAVQPNPVVEQAPKQNGEQKKLLLWFIGGLILIILVVGGAYWYLSSRQVQIPQPQVTAPPRLKENLEAELDALKLDDVDAQFTEVDQDLQSL